MTKIKCNPYFYYFYSPEFWHGHARHVQITFEACSEPLIYTKPNEIYEIAINTCCVDVSRKNSRTLVSTWFRRQFQAHSQLLRLYMIPGRIKTHTDWTRFSNATRFGFLLSFNFRPFQFFFKFSKTFQQFKLVNLHILQNFFSCSVHLLLKNENSRRRAKSRPVCVGPSRSIFFANIYT